MKVWLSTFPLAGRTQLIGQAAEAAGFYGMMLTDSQVLVADPFIELAAVADTTRDLRIGTCASNLVTRHPTVVAAMTATLQERSGGRMVLGIARGDSALTKVGLRPLSVDDFGRELSRVRQLVRGDTVDYDGADVSLTWSDRSTTPASVWGVASGPHAIEAVAAHADGLILQVGSDPAAVERSVRQARDCSATSKLTIAAYVIVGLQRPGQSESIGPVTQVLARMADSALEGDGSRQAQAARSAAANYSLQSHGLADAEGHPEIEEYALRGDARQCSDHLRAIAATGCDEMIVILGSVKTPIEELIDLVGAFGADVLPTLETV